MRQMISLSLLLTLFAAGCSSDKSNDKEPLALAAPNKAGNVPLVTETPVVDKPALETPVVEAPVVEESAALSLDFVAKVNGQALKCYDKTPALLAEGQIFTDVRMFISNLVLVNDAGEEIKLALDLEKDFKNLQFVDEKANAISLLNFLDPSCASSDATKTLKSAISGLLPYGHYKSLKFQIGLPYVAQEESLVKIPSALAPTDMAWMWEHFPAEFQIETNDGKAKKILNALISNKEEKPTVTLALDFTHAQDALAPKVELELSKLFLSTPAAFISGLEKSCNNSNQPMTEASPNCAQAYKALGREVLNPKEAYAQSVFSIVP